jgi:5-methylcytosine-specific restriction endonuclease McrA
VEYDRIRYETRGDEVRDRVKRWRTANPARANAADAAKIKKRKNATPPWLSTDQWSEIVEFYELAARRTRETGVEHHVDHIVPIAGKNVCGLNVPWNLQVLTARENMRKHAKFIEE